MMETITNMTVPTDHYTNIVDNMSFVTTKPQKRYMWKPQEDITAHELALCLPLFFSTDTALVENLPDGARRHFGEVE